MKKKIVNKMAVLLLAEGGVRHKDQRVTFTNTTEVLQKVFRDLAKDLGYKVCRKNSKQFEVFSKPLCETLFDLSTSFRTMPCATGQQNACPVTKGTSQLGPSCKRCKPIGFDEKFYPPASFPKSVLKAGPKETAEYLKIFCSCDGGPVVGSDKRNDEVIVRVGHPILRHQIIQMFKKVDIKVGVRGTSLVFIKRKSEIKKFHEKIGFIKGLKTVRGSHKGTEKNKLVRDILKRHYHLV
ncbi:MAG: hypothetical protein ACE5J7_00300 [Candidatus Aenigmatarchaeota archaeon]